VRYGAISKPTDVGGRLAVLTDYGCYPADEDYVALLLKEHHNGYQNPRNCMIILMFGDFMDCLSYDERDCE
jgi:hypothetical protein